MLLLMLTSLGLAVAGSPAEAAKSSRCTSVPEKTLVTWTTATDVEGGAIETRSTSRRAGLVSDYTPDPRLQSGLAAGNGGTDLVVAVKRDSRGRGRPAVCSGADLVALLPAVAREEIVGSASVNGRRVAWRTWRPEGPGALRVATIRVGRTHDVHRAAVPFVGESDSVNAAIHLLPSGTVAWKLGTRAWVWPIGRRPVKVPATPKRASGFGAPSIRILDDRNVLVDDSARAYRPLVPGSCGTVIAGGATTDLVGWRLTEIDNGKVDNAQEFSSSSSSVVCDPATGAYLAAASSGGSGGTYLGDPGYSTSVQLHRSGAWLLATQRSGDGYGSGAARTIGRNTMTGESFTADGGVAVEGPEGTPTATVVIGSGYTGWCTQSDAGAGSTTIWLADANGTRRLPTATVRSACDLKVTGTVLTWGPTASRQSATISRGTPLPFG